ncbi:MAG TPA: hypothetical protein VF766_13165 [Pyrinomonadaceae bacterium]
MREHKTTAFLVLLTITAVVATSTATLRSRSQDSSPTKKQKDEERYKQRLELEQQFPIVDFTAPEPSDPVELTKRRRIGKKHDKADLSIDERADTIMSTLDWAVGLPALPVAQSQAIVIGEIINAQAYLSNDKTSVYSEFTVRVDEVLKDGDGALLSSNNPVAVERSGGRVKFPSGHVTLQLINGQRMPRQGRRYVLFLTRANQEDNYEILTGYELRAGRVFPLDSPGGDTHPMAAYKGIEESSLLKDLRAAIANPLN